MADERRPAIEVMGRIRINGVDVRGSTQARIVCALALNAGAPIRSEDLLEYCWSDEDRPMNGARALSTPMSRIRQYGLDGRALSSGSLGYLLDADLVDIDVVTFEALTVEAQAEYAAGRAEGALERIERALAIWRGEPCDAVSSFEWALPHLSRLSERRLELIELRASIILGEAGAPDRIVAELSDIARRYPDREATWCLLAESQYRLGNQVQALRTINTLRAYLRDEIGVDVSP